MGGLRYRLSESRVPNLLPALKAIVAFPILVLIAFIIESIWIGQLSLVPSDRTQEWLRGYWWLWLTISILTLSMGLLSWWAEQGRFDPALLQAAKVKRASRLKLGVGVNGGDVLIPEFNADVYLTRATVETNAKEVLDRNHALILRGRAQCGKTRIAARIICSDPESVIIQPLSEKPPMFSQRGVGKSPVFLFLDDLHAQIGRLDAQMWWDRTRATWGEQAYLVATVWPGDDWDNVTRSMQGFVRAIGDSIVDATPFSEEEGRQLHALLGLKTDFELNWDGTPGGLAIGLSAYNQRYRELKDVRFDGVRGHWLLDSARILSDAGQFRLKESTLRSVAELIVGQRTLSNDQWREIKEQTTERGFGSFQAGIFATYSSYVSGSTVVDYVPTEDDFRLVGPLLAEEGDYASLVPYAYRAYMKYKLLDVANEAFEVALNTPNGRVPYTFVNFAHFLTYFRRDHDRAEGLFQAALKEFPSSSMLHSSYADFLSRVRREHGEALEGFEKAIRATENPSAILLTRFGIFLSEVREDYDRAELMFDLATKSDPDNTYVLANYGRFLLDTGRDVDLAIDLYNCAETHFKRAIENNPHDGDQYCSFALFLERDKRDYQRAEQYYRHALEKDPTDLNARATLAGLLLSQDNSEQGYQELDRARRLNLDAELAALSVEVWFYRLIYYRTQAERMLAIRELRILILTGNRSLRWDFSKHVEHAYRHGHEDADWISYLADVISVNSNTDPLEDWPAWRNSV